MLDVLYDDLLYIVLKFLNKGEIYILFETSKQFNNIIKKYSILKKHPNTKNILSSKNLLRWALKKKDFKITNEYTYYASKLNKFKMLKYLHKKGFQIHNYCSVFSIMNNNMKMFFWIYKKTETFDHAVLTYAIRTKNITFIKWLIKNDCLPTCEDINIACLIGNLDIVKILINTGVYWDSNVYYYSCMGGRLCVLKYLFKLAHNDLSKPWWTAACCATAAEYNHLHILKYLRKNGCPWDENTTKFALINNNIDILKWSLENNCRISPDLREIIQEMNIL